MAKEWSAVRKAPQWAGGETKDKPKRSARERVIDEIKRFFLIAVYLWILLTLFVLQETIIQSREHSRDFTPFGFAIVNAFIFAKVILIAEDLHFGRGFEGRPLIYPTLFKSVAFGILCVCVHVVEKVLVGLWHGKLIVERLFPIGVTGLVLVAITLSVELIPLFALRELGRVIGRAQLRALFLSEPRRPY